MDAAEQLMRTVRGRYDQLVAEGVLERDPAQAELASRLDLLSEQLGQTTLAVKGSSLGWLFGRSRPKQPFIRGLYIHGSVGRGKTMLMDLFFERVAVRAKRRSHFHAFMADVQDRIHQARQDILAGRLAGNDPIVHVAAAIAGETKLLCFDEFAVNDIADAMILGRLFARLFELGTVMVATSNVVPQRLYWEGLNRALFLPFIDLLSANVDVFELDARTDYRSERQDFGEVYFSPLGPGADAAVDALWQDLAGGGGMPADIQFRGRKIHVPRAARGAARFQFTDLCHGYFSAADYLQIAARYGLVFVEHIPVMGSDQRNEAKRFINLIDTFYDNHVLIVVSAAAEPDALFKGETGAEAFEFARTASRLREMRSREYFAAQKDLAEDQVKVADSRGISAV